MKKTTKTIMFLGTGSDVGKSVLAAALCRVLHQNGVKVAPFKAQNMALNSFVTRDGGEMGRAQVMQAEAAGIEPHVDMNPILLKPTSYKGSQVIVLGRPVGNMSASDYYRYKSKLLPVVMEAFERLAQRYDVIVMEGAGSAVELNLKSHDLVNLSMAKMVNSPCILVGDIDRGGIFAALLGSLYLLDEEEKQLIKGLIVNKFRGDPSLFKSGIGLLEEKSGKPVLGVIPYFKDIILPQEDSVALSRISKRLPEEDSLNIGVVRLPYISNYTDFDVFEREPGVSVNYFDSPEFTFNQDLIIIPGSKNTINDLIFLHESGLADSIRSFWKTGRMVIGVCGGYQILGLYVKDYHGCESTVPEIKGLEILPMVTEMSKEKITRQVEAKINEAHPFWDGCSIPEVLKGYEIHMGRSYAPSEEEMNPGLFIILKRLGAATESQIYDGMASKKHRAWGTYIHGIFDNDSFRKWLLSAVASYSGKALPFSKNSWNYFTWKNEQYDLLASLFRKHVDMDRLYKIIGL